MELELKGKTALVTGASADGLGRAIAKGLAAEGVQLCVAARRKELLEQLAEEVVAAGGLRPVVLPTDLMQEDGPAKLVQEAISRMGSVNILVNSAGFGKGGYDINTPEEEWQREMTLIFHNIRRTSLAVVPDMIKHQWGRIISVTGHLETNGRLGGALSSKAAVHGFSKGLSCEVARQGVTVNCISPGKIMSEQVRGKYTPERFKKTAEEIPIGRFGRPEEFARLAVFIASPMASYITGTIMHVDGGYKRYAF